VGWIKRFILFHGKRHPRDMGGQEVQQFLSHLAVAGHVAASTQSQALSAVLFLYQQVLKQDIGWLDDVVRAKKPHRIPVVLSQDEVKAVLAHLSGTTWIMATLLYGAGLRLLECLRLRVKDVDFTYNQIVVRDGKGRKDRVTMLPQQVKAPLQRHLHDVQQLHVQDVQAGAGHVYLPYALERKYPNASREWIWQYVFPAARPSRDPRTGIVRRHHIHKLVLQRAVHAAVRKANITKPASGHTAALVCDPFTRSGVRHSDGAGITRAQRRQYDDDLYARAQSGWSWGQEPSRPPVGGTLTGTCRVWPVECMMHANGYWIRFHERILD
jgi:integron integrase